eukprot:s1949_g13.t1
MVSGALVLAISLLQFISSGNNVGNTQRASLASKSPSQEKEVWVPGKRRSRSKSARGGTSYQAAENVQEKKEENPWSVFPSSVPWIPSTPASRVAKHKGEKIEETGNTEMQGQAVMAPGSNETPEDTWTAEEEKKLEHLKGLQTMGMELPGQLMQELDRLTAKQQAVASRKSLTHGHLNRLNKLKSQVGAAGRKIQDLDKEWKVFMESTMMKVRQHALLYQQCRADLLETFNTKMEELRQMKLQVSEASQSLLDQPAELPQFVEEPDVAAQMGELMSTIDQESLVGMVDLTDDIDEVEMDDVGTAKETTKLKSATAAMKAFRASTSPNKVAQQHLKVKPSKEAKDREEK